MGKRNDDFTSCLSREDESVNLSDRSQLNVGLFEQRGFDFQMNHYQKSKLDNKMDCDEINESHTVQNITEMIKAQLPILQFKESQQIIDEDLLRERMAEAHIVGAQQESVQGGINEELRGTLYTRLSKNPKLFYDKVERAMYFSESDWQSVSSLHGCWICNSNKILDAFSKRQRDRDCFESPFTSGLTKPTKIELKLNAMF